MNTLLKTVETKVFQWNYGVIFWHKKVEKVFVQITLGWKDWVAVLQTLQTGKV